MTAARAAGEAAVATLVEGVAERGYAVVRDALPAAVVAELRARARALDAAGALAVAGVGRGRRHDAGVRGDSIAWLDGAPNGAGEAAALALLETLRATCNRALMLGLFDYEGHYALYPPGAFYARHRDRFRDDDARALSCILYLNDAWQPADGGALRIFVPGAAPVQVLPEGGTVVAFLAAEFEHEVLPATRERLALTGWFRRRGGPAG